MRKIAGMFLICLVMLICVSCSQSNENTNKYIGHIRLEENKLYVDEVEWITDENKDRINELKLTEFDMASGYYIYNPSSDLKSFQINEKTVYSFIDWGTDFVGEDEDRRYSTTKQEEFIKYLNTYSDKAAKVPFWVETKDGYVVSIKEEQVN
ncbi:hypothetical protein [Paenibacillus turpanensis]|uniref:hypothetical protein n=1 Tax=Paenibacillus turpanensis TaxID=2689078 RepID=UPI00140A874E|nr:hypothetical protein [Paenibacillus turpanensis]